MVLFSICGADFVELLQPAGEPLNLGKMMKELFLLQVLL